MQQDTAPRPAAVYRLYDEAGRLLYIGSAYDPKERCKAHRSRSWWPDVTHREEEWHDSRVGAYIAELEAIRTEEPPHNLMGTSRYVCPDTPGVRRRNALNALRSRSKRAAELLRAEIWEAGRLQGVPSHQYRLAAQAAYIDVLDESGAWPKLVDELRAELYGSQFSPVPQASRG